MLKQLHPAFQLVIIALLFVAVVATAVHFHVGFLPAFLLGLEGTALGASLLTHEEHVLDYNLEDLEQDELARLEAEVKAAIAKGKGAVAAAENTLAGRFRKH